MNDKIGPQHLARKAILYVRQSSAHQVQHNEESRRMQYAMQEQLHRFGWVEVEVIDEDLGRSASGSVMRTGFEKMIAEVCLGDVGAVAAREVSRFARNSREWQKLVEVCRMVDTLLIDQETVYHPRRSNDRLLLGLKGSLNEYELDLLRQRAWDARREKAKRGELVTQTPIGFLKTPDQRIEKDPDLRVQEAILLIFKKCRELGSARQALLWMIEHGLQIPTRRFAAGAWETRWRRPDYRNIYRIITNPIYAGAYAYGRTAAVADYSGGAIRKRMRRKKQHDWLALLPEHHEGYISWNDFEQLQCMLKQNRQLAGTPGAVKGGQGLLGGLLRCHRCGRKLLITYTGREHNIPRYTCARGALDQGEPRCLNFGGVVVDATVGREILRVVQPAAIEAALQAGSKMSQQNLDCIAALERDLTAAEFEAARHARQYHAADPENRLVAVELERRWEAALQRVADLSQRLAEQQRQASECQPPQPSELTSLAHDLDEVWQCSDTDVRLKKRIVRTLVREIIVDVDRVAGEVILVIHWQGGAHTEVRVPARKRGQNSQHTPPETVEIVRQLALLCADELIAAYLNRNGLRTGTGNRWTKERVASLRGKRSIPCCSAQVRAEGEWMTLTEAAKHIGVSSLTLRRAIEQGKIAALHPLPDGPWIIRREDLDSDEVQQLVRQATQRRGSPGKPDSQQRNLDFSGT